MPVQDLVQETRKEVKQPDAVIMLGETLPTIPSSTLSDFAIWKSKDRDELEYVLEFKPSLYPAASVAMGIAVPENRRKWILLVLGIVFSLAALPFVVNPTMQNLVVPASWGAPHSKVRLDLPIGSKRNNSHGRSAISNQSTTQGSGALALKNYTAQYGMGHIFLPSKIMITVKRTVSHWIDWIREALEESIQLDM